MATKPAVNCDGLKTLIREVPDFPKKGILFYDITTLLKDKKGFATLIDAFERCRHGIHRRLERRPICQQRRDVSKENAGFGKIGN